MLKEVNNSAHCFLANLKDMQSYANKCAFWAGEGRRETGVSDAVRVVAGPRCAQRVQQLSRLCHSGPTQPSRRRRTYHRSLQVAQQFYHRVTREEGVTEGGGLLQLCWPVGLVSVLVRIRVGLALGLGLLDDFVDEWV